jgi:mannose-1-phosphate guanylyltransferase / mannose-6-phosphate isomerase
MSHSLPLQNWAACSKSFDDGNWPNSPETGYGFLLLAEDAASKGPQSHAAFVEKPDAMRVAEMVADGRHLWNAGIFLFTVESLVAAFAAHAPEILAATRVAVHGASNDLSFNRLDAAG